MVVAAEYVVLPSSASLSSLDVGGSLLGSSAWTFGKDVGLNPDAYPESVNGRSRSVANWDCCDSFEFAGLLLIPCTVVLFWLVGRPRVSPWPDAD